MKSRFRKCFLAILIVSTCAGHSFGQCSKPEPEQIPGFPYTIIPLGSLAREKPVPAIVISTQIGCRPKEVLLGQVGLRSTSTRAITSVRLRWSVRLWKVPPALRDPSADILLSGETPTIDVGLMRANERVELGMSPIRASVSGRDGRKVEISFPLISLEDIKPLTTDGTLRTLRESYAIIVQVAEVMFDDGNSWRLETNHGGN